MAHIVASEHAIRAASKVSFDQAVDNNEHDAADEPHARTSALRPGPFDTSALDLNDTGSVTSLDLPKTLTSERVRRRSEIARIRPLDSPPALEPEEIELPVIIEHVHERPRPLAALGRAPDVTFREDVVFVPTKDGDVELMPSFPSSLAPSIRMDDEADSDSTVPTGISAAQKAVYRRKFLLAFLPLCFSVFLNGWNDGTTGPLLPRIQSYYHVSSRVWGSAVRDLTWVDRSASP